MFCYYIQATFENSVTAFIAINDKRITLGTKDKIFKNTRGQYFVTGLVFKCVLKLSYFESGYFYISVRVATRSVKVFATGEFTPLKTWRLLVVCTVTYKQTQTFPLAVPPDTPMRKGCRMVWPFSSLPLRCVSLSPAMVAVCGSKRVCAAILILHTQRPSSTYCPTNCSPHTKNMINLRNTII